MSVNTDNSKEFFMKNTFKQLGFAVLMTAIALSTLPLTGCQDDDKGGVDTALNGTWIDHENGMQVKYNNGSFEATEQAKGTYTASGGNITLTITHLYGSRIGIGDSKWYSKTDLKSIGYNTSYYFTPMKGTYSVNSNTLTVTFDSGIFEDEELIFTKVK